MEKSQYDTVIQMQTKLIYVEHKLKNMQTTLHFLQEETQRLNTSLVSLRTKIVTSVAAIAAVGSFLMWAHHAIPLIIGHH